VTPVVGITRLPPGPDTDYGVFAALHARAFGPMGERPWEADAFRQLVESPGMDIYLAHQAGTAVGYILTRAVCDEAELISMAVDPSCHRSGIGRSLLDFAVDALGAAGVEKLFLETRADNGPAQHFYRQYGFAETGVRPGYYQTLSGNPVDALCFTLLVRDKKNQM
jgi:ribosomal-protein-alanine N-acetyltransferase